MKPLVSALCVVALITKSCVNFCCSYLSIERDQIFTAVNLGSGRIIVFQVQLLFSTQQAFDLSPGTFQSY